MKPRPSCMQLLLREGRLPTVLKINRSDPRVIEIAESKPADGSPYV